MAGAVCRRCDAPRCLDQAGRESARTLPGPSHDCTIQEATTKDNAKIITRRSVLQGLPVAAVAASVPLLAGPSVAAPAPASDDAHLLSLVEAWRAQYDDCAIPRPPAETDAAYERLWAIEQALVAVRPTTAEGYAAKLLILTSFGDFDLFDSQNKDALLAEAQEVAAIAPPRSFIEQREAIAARAELE